MHPVRRTVADTTRRLIRRFYEQFWNGRQYDMAERLIAADATLQGALGHTSGGPDGLIDYAYRLTSAFPDLQMHIDELIVERDRAAVRVSCTGTHKGELLGYAGTGRHVRYEAVVLFRVARGRIIEIRIHADRGDLRRQLSSVGRRSMLGMGAAGGAAGGVAGP